MKFVWFFCLATFMLSCSVEMNSYIGEEVDFTGTYFGNFDCEGALKEENGTRLEIIIKSKSGNTYSVDLGDDVIFEGVQFGDKLTIERQVLNENSIFDVITFEGTLVKKENTFTFNFKHKVDSEEESSCTILMQKF